MSRSRYRRSLVAGLLVVIAACGGTPTAWEDALKEHPETAARALRMAHDERVLISEYNFEYEMWSGPWEDCDSLRGSYLVALDAWKQNANDALAGKEVDRQGVRLSHSDDSLNAMTTAIGVVMTELGCISPEE